MKDNNDIRVNLGKNELTIDTTNITTTQAPLDLTSKFRASYYLIGAMLGRTGEIEVGMPGRMQTRCKTY